MKQYEFFNPILSASAGAGITPNFPLGVGEVDFRSLHKNIPHFEELAVQLGLNTLRSEILKNTLSFFQPTIKTQKSGPIFPAGPSGNDSPLVPVGRNSFGFPVYSNLSIRAGSYQNNQGVTIGQYNAITLNAVIFDVNQENNLVVTDIQGRDNSVIEYISKKSPMINCKGRVMSDVRNTYPRADVDNLYVALNSNKSLQVDSWFLNMLGIYNIVIKKKNTPQEIGSMEYQLFEFDAMGDFPVVLKLKK